MPTATKKRRILTYDQNGRLKKDAPETATTAKKPKIAEGPKSVGETREARLAKLKLSQTTKSSFEGDLERLTQEVNELKGGT